VALYAPGNLIVLVFKTKRNCGWTAYLDHGTGATATAAGDLDLHARDVMLGLIDVGTVNTNVLSADQVFSVGGVLGDLCGNEVAVVVAPGGRGEVAAIADTLLVDLEPIARSIVGLHASSGSLGHVHQTGAGMLELGTDSKLHADLVTRVDGQHLSLASRGEGTLVANNVRTICGRPVADVSRWVAGKLDRVVLGRASGLADVFETRLCNTANDVGVHEVVGGRHLGAGTENKGRGRELHADRAVMNVYREAKSEWTSGKSD
jgi:ABC-type Co2+ transport system permease subunit